jgi:four helix bundle protein
MAFAPDDVRVLQKAELVSDAVWKAVSSWDDFPRDAFGKPMIQAADSIGAHISESFGRFNSSEKVSFLYFARGSLFATKYWVNRALARGFLTDSASAMFGSQLTELARQLNSLAAVTRDKNLQPAASARAVREPESTYDDNGANSPDLFSLDDLAYLGGATQAA